MIIISCNGSATLKLAHFRAVVGPVESLATKVVPPPEPSPWRPRLRRPDWSSGSSRPDWSGPGIRRERAPFGLLVTNNNPLAPVP